MKRFGSVLINEIMVHYFFLPLPCLVLLLNHSHPHFLLVPVRLHEQPTLRSHPCMSGLPPSCPNTFHNGWLKLRQGRSKNDDELDSKPLPLHLLGRSKPIPGLSSSLTVNQSDVSTILFLVQSATPSLPRRRCRHLSFTH